MTIPTCIFSVVVIALIAGFVEDKILNTRREAEQKAHDLKWHGKTFN